MHTVCVCVAALGAISAAVAEDLPANQWVTVAEEPSGGTIARLVYVPSAEGMMLYGYPAPASRFEVDLFVTAKRQWIGQVARGPHLSRGATFTVWKDGRPMLPCINREYWLAGQSCWMPTVGKALYFAGGSTFTYDPKTRQWEDLKIPLQKSPPDVMLGSMAWDPVNKVVILFGGGYISAYKSQRDQHGERPLGTPWTPQQWWGDMQRATWAFDPAKGAWRRLETGSARLRATWRAFTALEPKLVDLLAAVRALALGYAERIGGGKAAEVVKAIESFKQDVSRRRKALDKGGGCSDPAEVVQCTAAGAFCGEVAAKLLDMAEAAMEAGDGWRAWRALRGFRILLRGACEQIAPAPLPRYYAGFVTDTTNKLLVLFGGHGGDRKLADTWVFDPTKVQWRRSRSTHHPPFTNRPAMSFDAKRGVVLLAGGWVYDAAKDEWKQVKLSAAKKTFHPWTSLAYDAEQDVHVAMTAPHSTYGSFGPRRTLMLKLDATKAVVPQKVSGPVWAWMHGKYEQAWRHLPKTQAEYEKLIAEQKRFLDGLPVNQWVRRTAPYNCQNRGYGSFCYDWDRDQVVNWGGGHSAYMGNEFSHYDVKSNRWIESWAPDLPPWPFGAPDGDGWNPAMYHRKGSAHGYHHYVYCADLKKIVFYGGALTYDSDRMRWADEAIRQVGPGSRGTTVDMSGSAGLLAAAARYYRGAPFGVWQAAFEPKTLTRIEGSDPPFGANDRAKAVFDSKRRRILWYGCRDESSGRTCNQLYAFGLATGTWEKITPKMAPADAVAPAMKAWGNGYSPIHDVLVILPGDAKQDTWVYDCAANTLRKAGPGPQTGRWGTVGVVYSRAHDVFIAMQQGGYGTGPVSLHFLRYKAE